MLESRFRPIVDEAEILALADELPVAVDRDHFVSFVQGFPRRYLVNTSRLEIVKHYLLSQNLGERGVISSIYPADDQWKIALITENRDYLFSRIAATLTAFGLNILSAEAFGNSLSLVLDTFWFSDPEGALREIRQRDAFQHFLEDVLEGREKMEPYLKNRLDHYPFLRYPLDSIELDNGDLSGTLVRIRCRDHLGLACLISRCISGLGFSIEMAYIRTEGHTSIEKYLISHQGAALDATQQRRLGDALHQLGQPAVGAGTDDNG